MNSLKEKSLTLFCFEETKPEDLLQVKVTNVTRHSNLKLSLKYFMLLNKVIYS